MSHSVHRATYQTIVSKCYSGCVKSPSEDLSRSQKSCLATCQDNYIKAMNLVAEAMKKTSESM